MQGRVAVRVGGETDIVGALGDAGYEVQPFEPGDDGPVDAVVVGDLDLPEPAPFAELAGGRFDELWEQPLARAIDDLAAARRRLVAGGRVVVVLPAISRAGTAGLAAPAAAVEGVRLLAVSAARQWAADGIVVNCVAVEPGTDPSAAVAFLASAGAVGISGATVPVGGAW